MKPKRLSADEKMVGQKYERLLVLSVVSVDRVLARCDCGTEKAVWAGNTRQGMIRSCGCLRRESSGRRKHGLSKTPEYAAWSNAKRRIFDPTNQAYANYGGRGLTMDPEYAESVEAFIRDVGPRPSAEHSIDRIDNDKGYVKGNLRWATAAVQTANRRCVQVSVPEPTVKPKKKSRLPSIAETWAR